MPYVERNDAKKITGVYARPQPGKAQEFVQETDAEIVEFRRPRPTNRPKAPPTPTGNSLPDLRADLAALRQSLIDGGYLDEN